jgi:hypothetical protein
VSIFNFITTITKSFDKTKSIEKPPQVINWKFKSNGTPHQTGRQVCQRVAPSIRRKNNQYH